MRNWITIVENARPDAASVIATDRYIDEILASGTWVQHGSHVEDIFYDNDIPNDVGEQKRFLQNWLPQRAQWIEDDLASLDDHDIIARAMYVTDDWLADLENPSTVTAVGIYFSSGEESANPYGDADADGHLIYINSTLGGVTVNWPETIKSRTDYKHGDEEYEIQLARGTAVQIINISDELGNLYPIAQGKRFIA